MLQSVLSEHGFDPFYLLLRYIDVDLDITVRHSSIKYSKIEYTLKLSLLTSSSAAPSGTAPPAAPAIPGWIPGTL
jgi:hypothetical protein